MIKALHKKKINFKKKEVYEFHFMNQFYFHSNYLFGDLEKIHSLKKGRQIVYSDDILNDWISNFNKKKHKKILDVIGDFLGKKEYHLCLKQTN